MAFAVGEEIGQEGKVLSIVLILANTHLDICHVCGYIKFEWRNNFSDRREYLIALHAYQLQTNSCFQSFDKKHHLSTLCVLRCVTGGSNP